MNFELLDRMIERLFTYAKGGKSDAAASHMHPHDAILRDVGNEPLVESSKTRKNDTFDVEKNHE